MKTISLINDFTDCPSGRYRKDGEGSGQEFREDHLELALITNDVIIVNLDGADALPPAFLDEAFGILARDMGRKEFDRRLTIVLSDDRIARRKLNMAVARRTETVVKVDLYHITPYQGDFLGTTPKAKDLCLVAQIETYHIDEVFNHSQNIDSNKPWTRNPDVTLIQKDKGIRSTSVGDALHDITNDKWYVVAPIGLREIADPITIALANRSVLMGLK